MAGRNTTRDGPHGRGWESPVTLTPVIRAQLEDAIGRALEAAECEEIEDACALARSLMRRQQEEPRHQDVLRTLRAIAAASPDDARELYRRADGSTKAQIDTVLIRDMRNADPLRAPAAQIPPAAARAAERCGNGGAGGRPRAGYQVKIAEFARESWRVWGGAGDQVWHSPGGHAAAEYASPLVRWTAALLELTFQKPDLARVVRLLKENS